MFVDVDFWVCSKVLSTVYVYSGHIECTLHAQNYWMLFGTRLLVGVGEASYATIAPTILADLFPAEKRLRILSIFYLAMPLGRSVINGQFDHNYTLYVEAK